MIKRCKICKYYFHTEDRPKGSVTCSPECEKLYNKQKRNNGKMEVTVKCAFCGGEFTRSNPSKIYCSVKCRNASYRTNRKLSKSNPVSEIQNLVAQTDEIKLNPNKSICKWCGKEFETTGKTKRKQYCSAECKLAKRREYSKQYREATYPSKAKEIKEKKEKDIQVFTTSRYNNTSLSAGDAEMRDWHRKREARKKWEKVPLEEAAAICKKYNLSYPEYQYRKQMGTLNSYIYEYEQKHREDK